MCFYAVCPFGELQLCVVQLISAKHLCEEYEMNQQTSGEAGQGAGPNCGQLDL